VSPPAWRSATNDAQLLVGWLFPPRAPSEFRVELGRRSALWPRCHPGASGPRLPRALIQANVAAESRPERGRMTGVLRQSVANDVCSIDSDHDERSRSRTGCPRVFGSHRMMGMMASTESAAIAAPSRPASAADRRLASSRKRGSLRISCAAVRIWWTSASIGQHRSTMDDRPRRRLRLAIERSQRVDVKDVALTPERVEIRQRVEPGTLTRLALHGEVTPPVADEMMEKRVQHDRGRPPECW